MCDTLPTLRPLPLSAPIRIAMHPPQDFLESRSWPAVLDERRQVQNEPAVYVLLHEHEFGRLEGASRVLYIGSTGQLGGDSDCCRLRIYRYPNGRHANKLRRSAQLLVDSGIEVTLRWKHFESRAAASIQEACLLRQYAEAHGELPPFNERMEGRLQPVVPADSFLRPLSSNDPRIA